jgi:hypothetical protein
MAASGWQWAGIIWQCRCFGWHHQRWWHYYFVCYWGHAAWQCFLTGTPSTKNRKSDWKVDLVPLANGSSARLTTIVPVWSGQCFARQVLRHFWLVSFNHLAIGAGCCIFKCLYSGMTILNPNYTCKNTALLPVHSFHHLLNHGLTTKVQCRSQWSSDGCTCWKHSLGTWQHPVVPESKMPQNIYCWVYCHENSLLEST